MEMPAGLIQPVLTLPIAATGVSQPLLSRAILLYGFAIRESSGAATADIDLIDGADVNGEIVCPITLGAAQSVRDYFPKDGLLIEAGLFLKVNSGTVRGSIFWRYVPRDLVEADRLDEVTG